MPGDGLAPLRDVIARHGLAAKKSLGQNFLLDLNLTGRIARLAGPLDQCTVVEVGPGPGGLTRALLAAGARHIVAIERDPRALPALGEIADAYPGRITVIEGDALQCNWPSLVAGPARIVANLPYNIATPLLTGWLTGDGWPPWFLSATLMFQREVAMRIVAAPGSKTYGRLSVISQWRCDVHKAFDIDRRAFTPPPKVTSSVVQFTPRSEAVYPCRTATLEKITAAAFGQRRKMLRSSLRQLFDDAPAVLAGLGILSQERAEQLSVEQFCRLAAHLDNTAR